MTQSSGNSGRWFLTLLTVSTLLQAATAVARPMASYRALEIGMEPSSLGLVAAAFAIAPVVFALSIGRRIDRFGAFPFLIGAAMMMAVSAAGLSLIGTAPALLALIAVLGLSQLVFVISNQALIGSRSPVESYDSRYGHLSFVASLGQLIGPIGAGLIAADGTREGTSNALLFGAVLSLLAVPVIARLWHRDPGVARPVSATRAPDLPLLSILRLPGMGPAMLASMTVLATIDVMVVYLPALGEERGLSVAIVSALLAVRALASMASRLLLGRLVALAGRERLMVVNLLAAAISVISLPFLPLPVAFAAMAIAGWTLGVAQPMTMAWVAARATKGSRGAALSVRLLGNRVGQVVIPLAAGSLAAVTGTPGVLAAAGLTVALSAAVVASRRTRG